MTPDRLEMEDITESAEPPCRPPWLCGVKASGTGLNLAILLSNEGTFMLLA